MRVSNRKLCGLLALVLALCAVSGVLLWRSRPSGSQVVVTVNGEQYGVYDLYTDQTVEIRPADGSWHNVLRIEDGRAEVVQSDCDNQICVHTAPLTEDTVGIIVCLPHGVVVELRESPQ